MPSLCYLAPAVVQTQGQVQEGLSTKGSGTEPCGTLKALVDDSPALHHLGGWRGIRELEQKSSSPSVELPQASEKWQVELRCPLCPLWAVGLGHCPCLVPAQMQGQEAC